MRAIHGATRVLRVAGAAIVAVALITVGAAPAAADQFGWSSPIPLERSGGGQPLNAVACPTTSQCTAVDTYGQEVTFNPTSPGTPTATQLGTGAALKAVACPSASQCTAVDVAGSEITFNPASPSGATPVAIDGTKQLTGVSCPSSSQCTAVDNAGGAVTFDPTSGAIANTAAVDSGHQLQGVACPTTTQCTTDDYSVNQFTFNPQTGAAVAHASVDAGHIGAQINAVTCSSAAQCTIVDVRGYESTFNPTSSTTVVPAQLGSTALQGVSCTSATQCVAVTSASDMVRFTASVGNATPPAPSTATIDSVGIGLSAIACPSATQCTAVDGSGYEVTFNPASPGSPTPVQVDGSGPLTAVSCPSATQCTTFDPTGKAYSFDPQSPGTATSLTADANGAAAPGQTIACVSVSQCTVVDSAGSEATFDPGSTSTPTTHVVDSGQGLNGVACPSSSQCTAVDGSGHEVTFAPATGAVNGAGVKAVDVGNGLDAVACPSVSQCTAVDGNGREVTFNPATGAVNAAGVNKIDGTQILDAVACPSSTQCSAVDAAGNEVTFDPTSGTVNGSGVTSPETNQLNAIACPSSTQCTTVDYVGREGTFNPTAPAAALVRVPHASLLNAISCFSAIECVAVDQVGFAFLATAVPVNTALPTISGTTQQGSALTESNGAWSNGPVSYKYQWEDCDSAGANCTADPGAIAQSYSLSAADVAHTVRVIETATNAGGSTSATSAATAVVLPLPPAQQSPPTITGTTVNGQTLTSYHGVYSNNPTSYQDGWLRCDANGQNCTAIAGQTTQSYTLTAADIGDTIRAAEIASNAGGSSPVAYSTPTAVISAIPLPPLPMISVTTLKATAITPTAATLNGLIDTKQASVSWYLQYGTTARYTQATRLSVLPAGITDPIAVYWRIGRLSPHTTYHYRLLGEVSQGPGTAPVFTYGRDLTFKTSGLGSLVLHTTSAKLAGGKATLALQCASQLPCSGRFSITTKAPIGKSKRLGTVLCYTAYTNIAAGATKQLDVAIYKPCLGLLTASKGHSLTTQFTARPRTGQLGVIKTLTLLL